MKQKMGQLIKINRNNAEKLMKMFIKKYMQRYKD